MVPQARFDLLKKPGEAGYFTILNGTQVIFPGGSTKKPRDVPLCGFDGTLCPPPDNCKLISSTKSGVGARKFCINLKDALVVLPC